ncbi:MAG: helix-turn-helix domain-containing protein [Candidatus Woesearchaeota archaeon]|nr:helix-turn-helix domain-containing protein [Nanoarchaeota archaeon]USN44390.1 MAG: helix-turn-helix domain-containing protein [Candidatus Woesearchaeota archaeon]
MSNLKYIKLQVEIPKSIWIYKISKEFPEEIITLNYSNPLSETRRQVFLSTISKKSIKEIYFKLNKEKQIKDLEMFGDNIKLIFQLNFLQKIIHQKLTIIFPVTIHDGYATIEIFADESQIKLFEKVFGKIKILKISDEINKKENLTLKQKEILETAYMLGFFSYPRKISLTQLAKHLKISKATLSENLRVAENKIISNLFLEK